MNPATEFFSQLGQPRPTGSNHPFWVHQPDTLWFVESGKVDLFLVPIASALSAGSRRHFIQVCAGEALFSIPQNGGDACVDFQAVGQKNSRVIEISLSSLAAAAGSGALASANSNAIPLAVDRWITALYSCLRNTFVPEQIQTVEPGRQIDLPANAAARPADGVIWAKILNGQLFLDSQEGLECGPGDYLPLHPSGLAHSYEGASFLACDTGALLREGTLWTSLERFSQKIKIAAHRKLADAESEEVQRLEAKAGAQQAVRQRAIVDLSRLLSPAEETLPLTEEEQDPLFRACFAVGQALGVPIKAPPEIKRRRAAKDPLDKIAKASRIRLRRVILSDDWWRQDNGPMLGFLQEENRPVALVPISSVRYELIDPAGSRRDVITEQIAHSLQGAAYTFYRPFPNRPLKAFDLVQMGLFNSRADLLMIFGLGVAEGLLGMLFPIVTGILFDNVIPRAASGLSQLLYLTVGLLVASFVSVIFSLTSGIAVLRLETRGNVVVQSAIWDRLLSLPLTFFRNYTSGDLTMRANGINSMRQVLSGAVMGSALSALFSVFSFCLLFYYSTILALVATGLVILNVAATALVSWISLRYERPICELQGRISGMVLQFITGISKLRVANAEVHAFAVWAKAFSNQKSLDIHVGKIFLALSVFNDAFPLMTSICLFAGMVFWTESGLSTGKFLAFSAAFSTFLGSMLGLSSSLISILQALPIYERAKPILEAVPEVTEGKSDPGELHGRIEVSHVCFRYKSDGPLVLNDVSFQTNPGEFIAIVGPSGSGKTSLFRLLLGFEAPESGTISFEGRDLSGLDVHAVRRQFGAVMQNGKLMPGDLFRNIVGSTQLTLEDAWEAARQAGLDQDIREMPMGMHTVLSEGAGTLSGGQRQRLMIARAIVQKPRILLFDEATSALDNRTQSIVSQSLEQMQSTRIVIAHRLSTIIHADRILVLKAGHLVQSGNYQQLIQESGPFAELAKRQLA